MIKAVILLALLSISGLTIAEEASRPLYIIFDGSNSMWGELPDKSRKIEVAREVFENLNPSIFANREVALRLYGHRRASDCSDTELAVGFSRDANIKQQLSSTIASVTPRGKTPITRSLNAALKDFGGKPGDILLISDGIETCDTDPCELVESWKDNNIDIRVHVVGLGLTDLARGAMQCIAEASGTQYLDANNVGELSTAVASAADSSRTRGEANPAPQNTGPEFKIIGKDNDGNTLPVKGTLTAKDGTVLPVQSYTRYVFEAGEYVANVGVPTLSGELYKPVTQTITVKANDTTKIEVVVPRPPKISTEFLQNDKQVRGALTYAYQNNKKLFSIRFGEEHFIMPGSYEFRSSLRSDNSDLRVNESIIEGEDKTITFNLVETVKTKFVVYDKRTGKKLRQHQQLWQNGELKYKVHHGNGAFVQPGVYTLKSEAAYTPYQIDNVEIPPGEKNLLEFTEEFGSVKLFYRFKQIPEKLDSRCWINRVDENGKTIGRGKMLQCDGTEVSLAAGKFSVSTNKYYGKFAETTFEIVGSESKSIDIPLLGE